MKNPQIIQFINKKYYINWYSGKKFNKKNTKSIRTLKLAKEYIVISEDKINIIKHCRKSILCHDEELWIKKDVSGNFDNPMGSFNGAILSEFIGYLLLYNINRIIDSCSHGLYRGDGLIIVDVGATRQGDIIRKNKLRFKLDIKTNLKIKDYFHVTLTLYNSTVSPFRKKKTKTKQNKTIPMLY